MSVKLKYDAATVYDTAVIVESVIINKPRKEVFGYMIDFSNHQKYSEVLAETRQTSDGEVTLGTRAIRKAEILRRKLEFQQEVVAFVPPEKFAFTNDSGFFATIEEYTFEETELGTMLTLRVAGPTKGLLGIGATIVLSQAQRSIRRDLQNLKKILETG